VSFLGLPADPRWNGPILEAMWAEKKIQRLDGIGCTPAAIHGSRDDLLARVGQARSLGMLPFPENNGPVLWPWYSIEQALKTSSLGMTSDQVREGACSSGLKKYINLGPQWPGSSFA
jgi:hypothetical protein